MQAIIITPT